MNALALVVGNNDYTTTDKKLNNAINDANAIAEKLMQLGYIVIKKTNCDLYTFAASISEFSEEQNKYDIALLFFSGHALQIEGENYLCGVDTSFVDIGSAKYTSIKLNEVLKDIKKANAKVNIVILDACRNNPFPETSRGAYNPGLAPVYAPKGTLIAFSTSPGETASDGDGMGGNHSYFTKAILNHIEDKNIPIEEFFKRVRTSVYTMSDEKQLSWEHTSLIGDYYFNSGQLIHSVGLPYSEDVVADANYEFKGKLGDNIIKGFKTHNYYKQGPAFSKFAQLEVSDVDANQQFLIGRNVLQTAIGGEYKAINYFENLGASLEKWNSEENNHILNGILYEIYFDSEGKIRQGMNFKSEQIDNIFSLEDDERYKPSFELINKQLQPFREYLFYIPSTSPVNKPLEIVLDKVKYNRFEKEITVYHVSSIKYQNIEIFDLKEDDYVSYKLSDFKEKLCSNLCIPLKRLTISFNFTEEEINLIYAPWVFQFSPKQ